MCAWFELQLAVFIQKNALHIKLLKSVLENGNHFFTRRCANSFNWSFKNNSFFIKCSCTWSRKNTLQITKSLVTVLLWSGQSLEFVLKGLFTSIPPVLVLKDMPWLLSVFIYPSYCTKCFTDIWWYFSYFISKETEPKKNF